MRDRHINPDTGSACVVLPDAYWIENSTGEVDIVEYLRGPVQNFFLGQLAVEQGDPWPFGEWQHGADGIIEHYGGLLGTNDAASIRQLLEVLTTREVKGHVRCPCGSGRRLRACHRELVRRLKERVPTDVLETTLAAVSVRRARAGVP